MADEREPADPRAPGGGPGGVTVRRFLALALPALGVLAAEPLYLLLDVAVVGRLGADALAGLALGALVLSVVGSQLTFLSYGTTARAARLHGAGDRAGAVGEGVQATWLAVGVGVVLAAAVFALEDPLLQLLAGDAAIAGDAVLWLRIALLGVPAILVSMAGNGWMRGVQDTVRPLVCVVAGFAVSAVLCPMLVFGAAGMPDMGLVGSAVANLVGQTVAAAAFLVLLWRERRAVGIGLRPQWAVMRAQMGMARDLILRSLGFQACFLSAAAVAARFGAPALAAHQVVLQLWNFLTLVLDSLAIAAQALVGAALGGGRVAGARALAWRITRWSTLLSVMLAALFAAGFSAVPAVFTDDAAVLGQVGSVWWLFVALIPLGGVVFALDGVLLGAGDARFLRTATLIGALAGFLPIIWASLVWDWGLRGIWCGLVAFLVVRLGAVVARAATGRWAVPGAVPA
ncbi:MATE family efflux transporter [Tomitella fengzijianii]|uniref:MATE family efflux transporter n=1 Tax=Tomitella fengzijianii TaxID=2597660 RepID=A0A516X3M9_9ACTN|nr:MATE family efflux transporter [Tomitella fengzijianii]